MTYDFNSMLARLKEAKNQSKLRTEDISKISNVPIGTLAKIFAGITTDPKLSNMEAIANALNVSIDFLIYGPQQESFDSDELLHIKKYRLLDADGKERIDTMLDMEVAQLKRKDETQSAEKAM